MLDDRLVITVRWNASGELDELPPKVEELTGYMPQEIKERFREIVTPNSAARLKRTFEEERMRRGESTNRVLRMRFHHKCGCVNEAEVALVFRRNRRGELTDIHGIVRRVLSPCATEVGRLWPALSESGQFALRDLARVFAGASMAANG